MEEKEDKDHRGRSWRRWIAGGSKDSCSLRIFHDVFNKLITPSIEQGQDGSR